MSVEILNSVFERSQSKGVSRLILLALADRSDSSGRSWCGIPDICSRVNASRGQVFVGLKILQKIGELSVLPFAGPKRCNAYQIADSLISRPSEIQTVQNPDFDRLESRLKGSGNQTQTVRNHKRTNGSLKPQAEIPQELLQIDGFTREWDAFVAHRRGIKKPMTIQAENLTLKKLAQNPSAAIPVLQLCQERGWMSFEWDWPEVAKRSVALPSTPIGRVSNIDRSRIDPALFATYLEAEFPAQAKIWTATTAPERVVSRFLSSPSVT